MIPYSIYSKNQKKYYVRIEKSQKNKIDSTLKAWNQIRTNILGIKERSLERFKKDLFVIGWEELIDTFRNEVIPKLNDNPKLKRKYKRDYYSHFKTFSAEYRYITDLGLKWFDNLLKGNIIPKL